MEVHLSEVDAVSTLGHSLLEACPAGYEMALQEQLVSLQAERDNLTKVVESFAVETKASLLTLRGLHDAVGDLQKAVEDMEKNIAEAETDTQPSTVEDARAELGIIAVSGTWLAWLWQYQ